MRRSAFHLSLVLLSVLFLLTACGTGPGGGGPIGPTGPVTTTLTPAGGTVQVVSDDLVEVTLEVPPGAVLVPVDLTLTPLAGGAGEVLRLSVEPAGTSLLRPATLSIELPDGQPVPAGSTLAFVAGGTSILLPTTVDGAAGKLSHRTTLLGYSEITPVGPTAQQAGNGWFNVAQVECQIALDGLTTRLEYVRNFPFSSSQAAHQLIQQFQATVRLCDAEPGDEEAFEATRELAKQIACDRYVDATADAAVILSDSVDSVLDLSGELLNWEGLKAAVGTDCEGLGGELKANLEAEFDEFVAAYESRMASGDFPTSYAALWAELKSLLPLWGHAAQLGLPEAEEKVSDRLLGRILSALRDEAYASCQADHAQVYLADILSSGNVLGNPLFPGYVASPQWASFDRQAILDDIQYCASALTLEVRTAAASPVAELSRSLQGGATPGSRVTQASTESGVQGTLALAGEMWAFNCAGANQAPQFAADVLLVKLAGVELSQLQPTDGRFLATPEEIDVAAALQTAGKDPTLMNTYPLEIWRQTTACSGHYGDTEVKLFRLEVEFDPAPVLSSASASPTTFPASVTTPVAYTLAYQDQGENLAKLVGSYALGDISGPLDIDLSNATLVSGFDGGSGNGTYTVRWTVHCSEAGINPLRLTFQLVDRFEQESEARTADATIDYSACSS